MSTIKTTHLQHPSAASPNLTLAADGSVSGGAGLGGLVHIATESFSGVSSVSLDNVFSSTYENYRVLISAEGSDALLLRYRSSGTDDSSGLYMRRGYFIVDASDGVTRQNAETFFSTSGTLASGRPSSIVMDVFKPFIADETSFHCDMQRMISASSGGHYTMSGCLVTSTSYDGFTFYLASGTATGTIRVYGYANS